MSHDRTIIHALTSYNVPTEPISYNTIAPCKWLDEIGTILMKWDILDYSASFPRILFSFQRRNIYQGYIFTVQALTYNNLNTTNYLLVGRSILDSYECYRNFTLIVPIAHRGFFNSITFQGFIWKSLSVNL